MSIQNNIIMDIKLVVWAEYCEFWKLHVHTCTCMCVHVLLHQICSMVSQTSVSLNMLSKISLCRKSLFYTGVSIHVHVHVHVYTQCTCTCTYIHVHVNVHVHVCLCILMLYCYVICTFVDD